MAYNPNANKTSANNPVRKQNDTKDSVFGIYLAEVVSTKDISRTGRIRVFIPAISKDKNTTAGYFDAVWTSPFAGSTDPRAIGNDPKDPKQTISSYGMWAVPPDMGNQVLVAFGDGNTKYPLVISCLFADKFNYMLPGNAGGTTFQAGNVKVPTMEKNKKDSNTGHNSATRPIQHTLAEALTKQGLIKDSLRGPGTSSARRESPSEVFGILTPGPRDPEKFDYRLGGHSITLDDNLSSRNIRIRTAQGNQILLDDTTGVMYFINKEGKVWMEFTQRGEVMLYAEGSISMRSKGDFSIRADQDVNIEAGQNINIKAAQDNVAGSYSGEGSGTGGDINIESKNNLNILTDDSFYLTTFKGTADMNFAGTLSMTTGKDLNQKVQGKTVLTTGKDLNISAGGEAVNEIGSNFTVKTGSQILLNSGGPDAARATTAEVAKPVVTTEQQDQGADAPAYDKTAEVPLTTGGERTGAKPNIKTIVSRLITAEPYEGHATADPASENPASIKPDSSLKDTLPTNSNGLTDSAGNLKPADINSPAGIAQATGFDANGKPVLNKATAVGNNFGAASGKGLAALTAAASGIMSSIPPLRAPTISVTGAKIIGIKTALNEIQARKMQIAVGADGAIGDLTKGKLGAMSSAITSAAAAKSPAQLESALKSAGITVIQDGTGKIYQDSSGNKIIDISNSLGSRGNNLLTQASLQDTANSVKQMVTAPVSDNQMSALTSFADHIGTDNFAQSQALSAVNAGDYGAVPNAMMEFSSGSYSASTDAVVRDDYVQRRQFEGELFQTPDAVTLPTYKSTVSFGQQARDIQSARTNYIDGKS